MLNHDQTKTALSARAMAVVSLLTVAGLVATATSASA